MERPLKILLLGDYSNFHRTLATGLRRLGCDVTVASDGSRWMECGRDFDIVRRPGKAGGLRLAAELFMGPARKILRGNDIVALCDPNFVTLRPQILRLLFDRLVRENGAVFLSAMSTDIAYLDMLSAPDSPLKYSEWFVGGKPSRMYLDNPSAWDAWHKPELTRYQNYVFSRIDGAVSALYEYQLGMERALGKEHAAYGGIPVDTSAFKPVHIPDRIDRVKLFLGRDRSRMLQKGSDLLEAAARKVVDMYPGRAELTIVENRPFSEFVGLMRESHVVLDQIYSYTPSTTPLMAMACGLNVVTGAEPEYYDFIGERENHPIINAPTDIEGLTAAIGKIVAEPEHITARGRRSREFVEKHNDVMVVAARFLDFWKRRMGAGKD